jgi:hypothetical protein
MEISTATRRRPMGRAGAAMEIDKIGGIASVESHGAQMANGGKIGGAAAALANAQRRRNEGGQSAHAIEHLAGGRQYAVHCSYPGSSDLLQGSPCQRTHNRCRLARALYGLLVLVRPFILDLQLL